jgi:hypothetical protein
MYYLDSNNLAGLDVSLLQGPEMHQVVSRHQEPMLLLDVSTLHRPVLHLDLSGQRDLDASTSPVPELHLHVPTLESSVLNLDIFSPQGPKLHLENRSLCCTWTCLHLRA